MDAYERIKLLVRDREHTSIKFKIRKNTLLKKLMNAYCVRTGMDMATTRFRYDGNMLNENDTPYTTNMGEGDVIEVFQAQIGG
ncbi:small ubiquitin-related modifier 2-like isoform X2 [Aphis gossypii]|uniref:small ubiquitin-related modifier 2-like isoform X2 n=1 Tax=Aphis gossypii TaxID=80765 RepID=UPI0021594B84|nr:small ubiquitin-related modifier 2-like isoform X2 [Aphis gossypii]